MTATSDRNLKCKIQIEFPFNEMFLPKKINQIQKKAR